MPLSLADTAVVIESPSDGPSAELVAGCESVLGVGHCLTPSPTQNSLVELGYVAQVTWLDPESLEVKIRLFYAPTHRELFERVVAFSQRDSLEQRQRAAGVIVAAGVVSYLRTAADGAAPAPREEPRPVAKPTAPPAAPAVGPEPRPSQSIAPPRPGEHTWGWGADAGPFVASGLAMKWPQYGFGLRGWFRHPRTPWRTLVGVGFAEAPFEPRLTSWTLDLAVAARIEQMAWLEPRFGIELIRAEVVATSSKDDRTERDRFLRYAVVLGSDFVLQLGASTAFFAAIDATAAIPMYDVWVAGDHVSNVSLLGWRASVGLRIGRR